MGFDALDATDSSSKIVLLDLAEGGGIHSVVGSCQDSNMTRMSQRGLPTIWINLTAFRVLYIVRSVMKSVSRYQHPCVIQSQRTMTDSNISPTGKSRSGVARVDQEKTGRDLNEDNEWLFDRAVSNSGVGYSRTSISDENTIQGLSQTLINLYIDGMASSTVMDLSDDLVINPDLDFECHINDLFAATSDLKMMGIFARVREPDFLLVSLQSPALGYAQLASKSKENSDSLLPSVVSNCLKHIVAAVRMTRELESGFKSVKNIQ
ncbi:hypothetical protein HK096_001730 [Nowakowskiella sp. JEL0078]|nr:hypothetical protein HK096_001730 [Nowakowskiella sp. JEL0078]